MQQANGEMFSGMSFAFFCIILLCFPILASTQNIRYTKNNIDFANKNMPTIAGTYNDTLHIIRRNTKGGFDIYLYNRRMEFIGTKQLAITATGEYNNIQLIPYQKFYYALFTGRRRERSRIIRVHASGDNEDQTENIKEQLRGIFPEYIPVARFQKVQDLLSVSVTFFDSLEQKVYLGVYHLDSLLQKKDEHLLSFAYNPEENIIHTIEFGDTSAAYIVKSFKYFTDRAGELDIFMFDFRTNEAIKRTITGSHYYFYNPVLDYNNSDSSLLFFSAVNQMSPGKSSLTSQKYYCIRMNKALGEISPPRFIETKKGDLERNIFFIDKVHSVTVNNIVEPYRIPYYSEPYGMPYYSDYEIQRGQGSRYTRGYNRGYVYRPETSFKRTDVNMKIIWSDPTTGKKIDTLFRFKKGKFKVSYLNSFLSENNSGLSIFFVTNYSKGSGISYISASNGKFNEEEFLMVDKRYEYLLIYAYKINDKEFIIPYVYDQKLGFVKISV